MRSGYSYLIEFVLLFPFVIGRLVSVVVSVKMRPFPLSLQMHDCWIGQQKSKGLDQSWIQS